jgi:hypothetical protein
MFDLNIEPQDEGPGSMEIVHPGQSMDSVEEVEQNLDKNTKVVLALAASHVNFLPLEIQPEDLTSNVDSGSGVDSSSSQNAAENVEQEHESSGANLLSNQTASIGPPGLDIVEILNQSANSFQGVSREENLQQVE